MVDTNKAFEKAIEDQKKNKKEGEEDDEDHLPPDNDSDRHEDICDVCELGGLLLCCDGKQCPKAYHLKCADLKKEPKGEWRCPQCQKE